MNFTIAPTDSPVVWQCIFQALEDYRLNKEKQSTSYLYQATGEKDIEVFVKKLPTTFKVTWRYV